MKLYKNNIYLLLIGLIALVMVIEKSFFLLRTDFAEGEVIKRTSKNTSRRHGYTPTFQLVRFKVDNKEVMFSTSQYANYRIGEKVKVVYLKSEFTNAKIFSFSEYWLPGFTRGLFVFIIVSGIVYAFMRKNEFIEINFKKPFVATNKDQPNTAISIKKDKQQRISRNSGIK